MTESSLQAFRHVTPGLRLFQGRDCLDALARELERLGSRRAVIFCGATLGRAGSPLDMVRAAAGGRCVGVHAGVKANSPLEAVQAAALELKRLDADSVIAVGGGSAMVTARAAAILLAEKDDIRRLCTSRSPCGTLDSPRLMAPKVPQLVIPTTPTTAIAKAGSAILDPVTGMRLALFDPKTRAQAVFIHPELLATAPRALYASAGVNTLTLAMEGLLSRKGNPLADALLMHAVRMLAKRLPEAAHSDDLAMRADLVLASILCGQGSDHTGAGLAIPLGHAIAVKFGLDMGLSDSIMLAHVLRFNASSSVAGLEKLGSALGLKAEGPALVESVIVAFESIFAALGLPRRLRDTRVTHESFAELAAITMDDWYLQDNPRRIRAATEVEELLELAW